jgi:hypothetical protein
MVMTFTKATKRQAKARVAFIGPSGSGKTWTMLQLGELLAAAENKRLAVIDSEHGSSEKYADEFDFDVTTLKSYEPENYSAAIEAAIAAGYGCVNVDVLSHAWAGKGGILEFVDSEKRKSSKGDAYGAGWGKATPRHNKMIETLLSCEKRIHLLVGMRSKMEYVKETDEKGKTIIRKVGMQPIQREGLEYEFDIVGDMDQDNSYAISKSRAKVFNLPPWNKFAEKPGKEFAETLIAWLRAGAVPETDEPEIIVEPDEAPAVKAVKATTPDPFYATDEDVDFLDDEKPFEGPFIDEAHRKLLMQAAKAAGLRPADLKQVIEKIAGVSESAKIPQAKFAPILQAIAPNGNGQ